MNDGRPLKGVEHKKCRTGPQKLEKVPAWHPKFGSIDSNERNESNRIGIINNNNRKTYPVILPELDRPVGPVDAEGPAPRRGADGVAGLEAPAHPEGAAGGGGFQGGRVGILEGNAVDGKLAGGGERKGGEGNASNLHDGWRMWVGVKVRSIVQWTVGVVVGP